MPHIARSSFGLPTSGGFVTGAEFLPRTGLLEDDLSQVGDPIFGSGAPLFGEGGLLGKKSREEQAILDAPLDSFDGDNKKEREASRQEAIKELREEQAKEREEAASQPAFGSGEPLLAAGGLLGPQAASQPESGLLAEDPGFFENLTRAASPGSLLNVIGRAAFGATEMERAENAAKREELTAGRRRRGAQQELTGLLSSGTPFEEIPLGLLGRVAPEAVVGGILGQRFPEQGRAAPSIIRELEAIGIDPMSAEGREVVLNNLKGQNAPDELLQRIDLQLKSLQLDNERAEIAERAETKAQDFRAKGVALRADLRNVTELVQLNDALEGTSQQPGLTFQDIRRSTGEGVNEIAELFGVDRSAARKIISQRDAFNKLANNFLIRSSSRFVGGTLTDQKLNTLRSSMAGVGITPGANRVILADTLDALLEAAEIEGVSIDNETEIRALATKLREQAGLLGDEEISGVENVPGFNELTKKQQDELRRLSNGQ